jgi:tetratricopeptide (TPR) repeat protein
MSNAAKHRKKAAEFEQLKQIDRAIASYIKAIEESESAGEDVDVALFNKVGDLALRQGRVSDAITYYERAVEHYVTSGLFNNAIALCNKILRNAPGRANVYFTLGRICARKGLRGDATRNFLEYATRMQQEGRVDEGMRALAEVADLMPELTEVRTLVEEHATRAGIALPRRRTPMRPAEAIPATHPGGFEPKSADLVFLDIDYGDPRRPTPRANARQLTPPPVPVVTELPMIVVDLPPTPDLETVAVDFSGVEIAPMDGLEANGDFEDNGTSPLDGFTPDVPIDAAQVVDPTVHPLDVTWVAPADSELVEPLPELASENFENAADDPVVANIIVTETPAYSPALIGELPPLLPMDDETPAPDAAAAITPLDVESVPELDAAIAAGADLVARAESSLALTDDIDAVTEQLAPDRPPFRLDPHDFILQGELPPLLLGDDVVDAGLDGIGRELPQDAHAETTAVDTTGEAPIAPATGTAVPSETAARAADDDDDDADVDVDDTDLDAADVDDADAPATGDSAGRPVSLTPSLPIAAVAAEATAVASSRRDALRAAVARLPKNWLLRRRLAEALFEAGEREAALAELETAQQGLVAEGEFAAAVDIAEELVQVSPDRVQYHQKRVELAVRVHDQQKLRFAYLDLADALVRLGEEARARAVYARVLEIDPYDDRARAALGAAAPPPPPPVAVPGAERPDGQFVDLADWLRDDNEPANTRMRMREPAISGDEQADFDALLRHFKEGVARSLGEEDFESHYDLGVAYKEMGLLDDAIAEFQKALRSRAHRLPAYEALGQCFVEQGRHQVAATVLSRALHEPGLDDDQRVGVLYLLAYSCEALQRWDEARSYYQRVYATDIHFRDVAARLAALEQAAR